MVKTGICLVRMVETIYIRWNFSYSLSFVTEREPALHSPLLFAISCSESYEPTSRFVIEQECKLVNYSARQSITGRLNEDLHEYHFEIPEGVCSSVPDHITHKLRKENDPHEICVTLSAPLKLPWTPPHVPPAEPTTFIDVITLVRDLAQLKPLM
jgi:hypothetical protein